MSSDQSCPYVFFIIVKELPCSTDPPQGSICYIEEKQYVSVIETERQMKSLKVKPINSSSSSKTVRVDSLQQLTQKEAEFLQALEKNKERLKCVEDRKGLDFAVSLSVDNPVEVEVSGNWCEGVVRYIGPITEPASPNPITGTFFGIELVGKHKRKGQTDGSFGHNKYFICDSKCGVFAPFTRIRAMASKLPLGKIGGDCVHTVSSDKSSSYMYFIIVKEPLYSFDPPQGCICYIEEKNYVSTINTEENTRNLPVAPMGCCPVEVEVSGDWCEGMVRYIGAVTEPQWSNPITGTFFGIELKGKHKGKGQNDGTYVRMSYFTCGRDCDVFVPFTRIRGVASKPPVVNNGTEFDHIKSSDKNCKYTYFIIVKKNPYSFDPPQGTICYTEKEQYFSKMNSEKHIKNLTVKCTNLLTPFKVVPVDVLQELSKKEAELLQAVENEKDRFECFEDRKGLDFAMSLSVDSPVEVDVNGNWCEGMVCYIGSISELTSSNPIAGMFFGIELKGKHKGKGQNDGTYRGKRFFTCDRDCGVFVPFTRVRDLASKPLQTSLLLKKPSECQEEPLLPGERVTFFTDDDRGRHGMVIALEKKQGTMHVLICTDTNEKGEDGSLLSIPLQCVIKEELLSPVIPGQPESSVALNGEDVRLSLGSMVEVKLSEGRTVYGTVRWIGVLPGMEGMRAGLELEEDIGVSDGTFKNERFFSCPYKRGLFVKLASCRPDTRFQSPAAQETSLLDRLTDKGCNGPVLGHVAPLTSDQVEKMLIGNMKGIQGHCNSCYMDSALFSLFSCSSVLDSLLFVSANPEETQIQTILLQEIVNPLRSKGFVSEKSIMKLRKKLQTSGHCPTFTTDEKDPEEFLSLLMSDILHLEPLLKLSTGKKVQESYYYQIFLDQNHSLVLPTVQQLLEHSFWSNSLRLAEVPSCLILQMPRFGKTFKMFNKIIPTLELDISDLLLENPQECILCGQLADEECSDCFGDDTFGNTGFKQFCGKCSNKVHSHHKRSSHKPSRLSVPDGFHLSAVPKEKLQLFAVLCIETSHYVSFVRHGHRSEDWIFFDSMADRQGDQNGYNIPRVQACPEVARYLEMPLGELAAINPRDMEGVAKRLFCDAYMYLYQSPRMALYR
ncbi:ubiquitin carboxyl-terminal hydrolase CYLD-like [Arapaima gigas]